MTDFNDLPTELLPLILAFVVKSSHLASAALVNSAWNTFATARLYERVSIYSWHRDAKGKVIQLFSTLSTCSHRAKHVRRLEIRDFPKAILNSEGNIPELVTKGLKNCHNLRTCTWTRDGSLSSEILGALSCLSSLRELEFNGHSQGQYDAKMLCQFRGLSKISVIMPSPTVVAQLGAMAGHSLRHLTIICKTSPVITDKVLEGLAPSLTNLEQFYITGCPKVTEKGILAVVSSTHVGLRALGLESISARFDMEEFSRQCIDGQALNSLRTITLTVSRSPSARSALWTKSVLHLLSHSPLERFQVYATSATSGPPEPLSLVVWRPPSNSRSFNEVISAFWTDLVAAHGHRLRRFSVLRMPLELSSVDEICTGCPNLEDLFVVTEPRLLHRLPDSLSKAKYLRTVHINFPLEIRVAEDTDEEDSDSRPVVSVADALAIVRRCGPSLVQFGCNTKVWRVGRVTRLEEDKSVTSDLTLLPYESPDIPEQFLVVRT